jgi:hypothetical protein
MSLANHLQGVVIEFWVDWYDGPVSGIATYEGREYWFEAASGFDPDLRKRQLFLYPITPQELARERELNLLYEEKARGRPVDEWPPILLERDFELPTNYASRDSVGWFIAG